MAMELLRVDPASGSGATVYYGYATPGTSDTDSIWSIKRMSTVGNVLKYEYPYITGTTMANTYPAIMVNDVTYIQVSGLVWANRSGYTYK